MNIYKNVEYKHKIKILDCTLRDGGYVNDWQFGNENIAQIIRELSVSKIDYIECGFLKKEGRENTSLFSDIERFKDCLPKKQSHSKFALMINFGDISADFVPSTFMNDVLIRVAFKKHEKAAALKFCGELIEKGYKLFINPMNTGTYNSDELKQLVSEVNKINPLALTIVDTQGMMSGSDTASIFGLIDKVLNKNIAICFHSHNNMQLSFSNAQRLIEICKDRELIIDSSVLGMGRGAGNLCTELIVQYLNENCGCKYNIEPVLKIIDKQIRPIFEQTPWGYSLPYFLTAINHCHPGYGKYLVDKNIDSVEDINRILRLIPEEKKSVFEKGFISQLVYKK